MLKRYDLCLIYEQKLRVFCQLMDWYNNEGNSESFKTITSGQGASGGGTTEWKLLNNINADCQSSVGGKPLYFVSKCTGWFL